MAGMCMMSLHRPSCARVSRGGRLAAQACPAARARRQRQHGVPLSVGTLLATIVAADAAFADDAVQAAAQAAATDNGWLSPIVDSLNFVLANIETVYLNLGVPYSYGWSIVTLTAFVKILTLPLTKQQVESAMAVQSLKPRIDIIKERYGEDKDKISKETSRLYEQAKVNPLAGCLPSLATIPIFIGLFRSLSSVASSGALDTEGFYWVPSLAGPTATGIDWLYPFVDGAPPIGWEAASAYLVLPVLLVAAQYVSNAIISPVDPNQEQPVAQVVIINGLPLMIGWFALNVPAGLSLYYFANSVFTSAQQIYFRKLGGAVVNSPDLGPVKQLGMGRRSGEVLVLRSATEAAKGRAAAARAARLEGPAQSQAGPDVADGNGAAANGSGPSLSGFRVRRKKKELLTQA